MFPAAIALALFGGLLGESVEVLRLETGGMAPADWWLRASLFAGYALFALVGYSLTGFVARCRETRLRWSVALIGLLVFLPWLNFDFLPRFLSWRTFLGSAGAAVVIVLLARAAGRFPKVAGAAVVLLAVAANGPAILSSGRGAPGVAETGTGPPPYNVVVLLVDTLRADHLGTYGYGRPTSPNIDRLAGSSVVFESARAQAPWTKPSTASLLTGTYSHRHGVLSARDALGPGLPTIAEALSLHGFRTAGFSANPWITPEFHFQRGFDEFVSQHAMGPQLTNLYRLLARTQRFTRPALGTRLDLTGWVFGGAAEANPGNSRRDELLSEAVVSWLAENGKKPFFLYVHLIGPHDPYDPPEEMATPFRQPGWNGRRLPTKPPPRVQSIFESAAPLPEDERAALIAQYDGAVAFADSLVGKVVDALKRVDEFDRTLLIVTSDHGEEFYEHENWRHGNQLYDEVLQVPLLIRFPPELAPERRADAAMLIDVFPTILGLLDLPPGAANPDGRNLFASNGHSPRAVFSEHWRFEGGRYVSRMVYRDGLKLTETEDAVHRRERRELYGLGADPGERRDLLATDRALDAKDASELEALLAEFGVEMPGATGETVRVDRSTQERLRALGY